MVDDECLPLEELRKISPAIIDPTAATEVIGDMVLYAHIFSVGEDGYAARRIAHATAEFMEAKRANYAAADWFRTTSSWERDWFGTHARDWMSEWVLTVIFLLWGHYSTTTLTVSWTSSSAVSVLNNNNDDDACINQGPFDTLTTTTAAAQKIVLGTIRVAICCLKCILI